jgi:hypothetical protein
MNINHFTIPYPFVLRKNQYTWERDAGLGWVVAASFHLIFPELHSTCFNYYVMARTSLLLRNQHTPLHHCLEVCIQEGQAYLGEGCWSWLGCFSFFVLYLSRFPLQLFQLLCNGQNFSLIEK